MTSIFFDVSNGQKLYITGVIDSWDDDFAERWMTALKALDMSKPLELHVNSEGGDLLSALAMYNSLSAWQGDITVKVDGIAGSAASLFCCFPKAKVVMPTNSFLFLHFPSSVQAGAYNALELRKIADNLDKLGLSILDLYQKKTLLSQDKIASMLTEETLLSASEALSLGFCDQITAEDQSIVATLPKNSVKKEISVDSLKAEHIDVYNAIIEIGKSQERERIKAIDEYSKDEESLVELAMKAKYSDILQPSAFCERALVSLKTALAEKEKKSIEDKKAEITAIIEDGSVLNQVEVIDEQKNEAERKLNFEAALRGRKML